MQENERWESNRMLSSGVVQQVSGATAEEEELEGPRVHILVRNILPEFLDGHAIFSKQFEPVQPIKVCLLFSYIHTFIHSYTSISFYILLQ